MEETSDLKRKEHERTVLLAKATGILQAAEAQSREVTAEEDARVLELLQGVRTLEEQIEHLKRHREPDEL
jgi:hypothetical protein